MPATPDPTSPIPPDVAEVVDMNRAGAMLRLYRPDRAEGTAVYARGGGWTEGTLDTHDTLCRILANRAAATVAAIDYFKAPTRRHPAQIGEVTAVVRWLQKAGQPIAIAGDGVGAYLAVQAAVRAVQDDIPIVALALIYPEIGPADASNDDTAHGTNGTDPDWRSYLSEHADPADPPVDLAQLELGGLPPTVIVTAADDPRRLSAGRLAEELETAGSAVTIIEHSGPRHDFLRPDAPNADVDEAITELADFLEPRLREPNSFAGRPY